MADPKPDPATLATGAQVAPTGEPPPMPTMAAPSAAVTTGPPPMPAEPASMSTVAAPSVGAAATAPPSMPTLAGTTAGQTVHTAPPEMPGPAAAPSVPPSRYQLGAEIARGGMGRVVDATDTRLGRVVAFKEALTTETDALKRFERETRITARLEHPSIVPVHDAGSSSNGAPFYVMRKVGGRPLERLVASAETLNERLALIPHIIDSAQAIAHAHERGIVHRDIKPSNILVGELGETVVIDWGLAKVIGEPEDPVSHNKKPLVDLSDSLKTRAGIVYGTPGFMAPEQLRGAPVDEGCDVYALGATLYHMLSRKPPHYAKTADEMMKAAVAAPPTPITELVAGVPTDLATIVDKALAHDPKVRYQNARELATDLQRFLAGQLVASHHYSTRDKLVRFVKRNRGLAAMVVALLLVGTVSVIRIVVERNRADTAAAEARTAQRAAESAERETRLRADALQLSQAASFVERNPTTAVALVKPLAKRYWREARAVGAAARAAGVAWGIPASSHTRSVELSRDGQRALSAGSDGVVRLHELAKHQSRVVVDVKQPVTARFASDERQVVLWADNRITVLDLQTNKRRELGTADTIVDLRVVGAIAYWTDLRGALWQLDLANPSPAPVALAMPERMQHLTPSPDGRWLALAGVDHLMLFDRTQPDAPPTQVTQGDARSIAWSDDGDFLVALVDQSLGQTVFGVMMVPDPRIVYRQLAPHVDHVAFADKLTYTLGATGVAVLSRDDDAHDNTIQDRLQLSGKLVGLTTSRGGTVIAARSAELLAMSPYGERHIPLQGVYVEGVYASPRAPFVVAAVEDRLLVWNLEDTEPRRIDDPPPGGARFATADQIVVGGSYDRPARAIDVATGALHELGAWNKQGDVAAIRAPGAAAPTVAVIDDEHHLHLAVPGRPVEDLPGDLDVAAFATPDKLVVVGVDGRLYLHDVASHQRTPLTDPGAKALGLAWGRGHHAWIAAALADGTLWRKNFATGAAAQTARAPRGDRPVPQDGKLLVGDDGSVVFLHDSDVMVWRSDGRVERLARTPRPLVDLGEAGPTRVVAFAADHSVYTLERDTADRVTFAFPSLASLELSMSPDTGLFVTADQGAILAGDPLARQQWILAPKSREPFREPQVSPDGRRVQARTTKGLLVWSLDLPDGPEATERWLDAMTNAVGDTDPKAIGWH